MGEIAALILAAGASSRFGRPKQLLELGGKRLIDHILDAVRAAGIGQTLVVTGAYHDDIASILPPGVTALRNENWRQGMGTSIAAGVAHLQTTHPDLSGILILLSDQPLVSAAHLAGLVRAAASGAADAVATGYPDGCGVPAVFASHTFAELVGLTGDRGARSLLRERLEDTKTIKPDFDPVDIDTEQDYEQLLSLRRTRRPDVGRV